MGVSLEGVILQGFYYAKKRGRRDSDGWKKAKAYGSKEIGRQSG